MGTDNWDAALVMRANELLTEIRRYHVDAEATRLQLASAAASMTRKVDELPSTVRRSVEESLRQDALIAERPVLVHRLDQASRMLDQLATQLNSSGLSFLARARRISLMLVLAGIIVGLAMTLWAASNGAKALKLSAEISELQNTVTQLREAGGQAIVKPCVDSSSRTRLCVRVDEGAGKSKDSYYFISR